MSQIRKSASFRSRIPVRARLPQRRCSSPQPASSTKARNNKNNLKSFHDRYYSSSSFSSSDESHESDEETLQVRNRSALLLNSALKLWNIFQSMCIRTLSSIPSFHYSTRLLVRSEDFSWRHEIADGMWSEHKLISIVNDFVVCLLTAQTWTKKREI